jgi:homoserine/homoserine lactone efflux protein
MQRFFRDARAVKIQNRIFGAVLMLMGSLLFLVEPGARRA